LSNLDSLSKSLGENRVKKDEPLSRHTTLKIGGPADIWFEARDSGELIKAVRLSRSFGVPVTVIGGGSNVLVSDLGVRGLVVKNAGGKIKIHNSAEKSQQEYDLRNGENGGIGKIVSTVARWMGSKTGTEKYDFVDLDYDEGDAPDVQVIVESGANLQATMNFLVSRGITDLQWYARIPGTIGGAVFNNIHGGSHLFQEVVKSVVVLGEDGEVRTLGVRDLMFDCDKSRFHYNRETVLEVRLALKKGDAKRAKATMLEWTKRKSVQPINSAGCVFKNIGEGERSIFGYPTTSAGYIVEHVLNMSGYKVGGASISTDHHNFIVNHGKATAKDYLAVRDAISQKAQEVLGLTLEDKIIRLGDFEY